MAHANSNGHAPIAAVAYYRMSTDQQEASIPEQRKAVERWAKEQGYQLIREYRDEGISGWKEEREGFQRLIRDLDRGDFQAVLCWDQNRFSRFPPLEANHYWYLLDKAGVHLATVNQGRIDWHSIAGWLTASIKQHADAQHRHQLSADVKRGMRAGAERGDWQGLVPYGYRLENKRLVLGDPLHVEVVRRIFQQYVSGQSIRGIVSRLNDEGIANGTGVWTTGTVRVKLVNRTYTGTFHRNEIEIPDNHPAIVDKDEFETVQRLLAERQTNTTPKRDGGGFLFSGILRCGKCGETMTGRARRQSSICYECQGFKQSATCDRNSVVQSELARHVITAIESRFMNPKVVQRLRGELHRQVAVTVRNANPDGLAKQLATVNEKLSKAKRRLVECDSDMLADVQEAIRALRREQEQLEAAIEAASTPRDTREAEADRKVDEAMKSFARLRETLQRADTVRLRELLRETVDHVQVWSDKETVGRRQFYKLTRGVVVLRGNNLFNSPGLTEQVIRIPFAVKVA